MNEAGQREILKNKINLSPHNMQDKINQTGLCL